MKINPLLKNFTLVILILLVVGAIFSLLYLPAETPNEISATQLVTDINQDKIKTITVSGDTLDIKYADDTTATSMKETNTSITDLLANLGVNKENLDKVDIGIQPAKED
ncbi:MAG: ATP-dependent metallopeptidase FtsH/Yme1/Tma family protein, partial [Candidatus Staskawiczbacteria bacterium]|nr:ATP-dependent metallopeptidase FtsH/Yme1/Tma family protein [Candidatus Staskawiczbacteria bacterium]